MDGGPGRTSEDLAGSPLPAWMGDLGDLGDHVGSPLPAWMGDLGDLGDDVGSPLPTWMGDTRRTSATLGGPRRVDPTGVDGRPAPALTVYADAPPKPCPQCRQWTDSWSSGTNCRTPHAAQLRNWLVS